MNQQRFRAFTLVELLIVVGIIAVLGITGISSFSYLSEKEIFHAAEKRVTSTIDTFEHRLHLWNINSYRIELQKDATALVSHTNLSAFSQIASIRSMQWEDGTGALRMESPKTGSGLWMIRNSVDNKIQKTSIYSGALIETIFSLPTGRHDRCTIAASFDGGARNSIEFLSLSPDIGMVSGDNARITMVDIRSIPGNMALTGVVIEDTGTGRTVYSSFDRLALSGAIITLASSGKEDTFEIR